jgi:hypothetical protein
MRSRTILPGLVAVVAVSIFGVAPAEATEPQRIPLTEVHNPVQDQGQACGFPVLWDIRLTLEGWNFFDNDGNLVRQQLKIREDNTITNLDSGLTLREGPDAFMQTTIFNPDGSVAELIATGLAANVQGDERLKDVGRVVWLPGTNEIVFAAGQHPVREAVEFGSFLDGLRSFCDVLS